MSNISNRRNKIAEIFANLDSDNKINKKDLNETIKLLENDEDFIKELEVKETTKNLANNTINQTNVKIETNNPTKQQKPKSKKQRLKEKKKIKLKKKKEKHIKQQQYKIGRNSSIFATSSSESNSKSTSNYSSNTNQPKRKPDDLLKLLEKKVINEKQYIAGNRLYKDYENSFKYCISSSSNWDLPKLSKTNKGYKNSESSIINNIDSYDRYHRALLFIKNINTRNIVKLFCCEGVGLTKIDNAIGKRGVAEVSLYYGLKELVEYYKELKDAEEN